MFLKSTDFRYRILAPIVLVMFIACGCCGLLFLIPPKMYVPHLFALEKRWYISNVLPRIVEEAGRLPGVSIIEIRDESPPDEINVYVTLEIKNKGTVTLRTPSIAIFTDTGTVDISAIRDCMIIGDYSYYSGKHIGSVVEIIDEYEVLYELLKKNDACRER